MIRKFLLRSALTIAILIVCLAPAFAQDAAQVLRLSVGYPLLCMNAAGTGCENLARVAGNGQVRVENGALPAPAVVEWLLK